MDMINEAGQWGAIVAAGIGVGLALAADAVLTRLIMDDSRRREFDVRLALLEEIQLRGAGPRLAEATNREDDGRDDARAV